MLLHDLFFFLATKMDFFTLRNKEFESRIEKKMKINHIKNSIKSYDIFDKLQVFSYNNLLFYKLEQIKVFYIDLFQQEGT